MEPIKVAIYMDDMWENKQQNNIININNKTNTIKKNNINNSSTYYQYENVFNESSSGELLNISQSIIDKVLNGYNGTILTYDNNKIHIPNIMLKKYNNEQKKGIVLNCFEYIFQYIKKTKQNENFLVYISYIEIYKKKIYDLIEDNDNCNKKIIIQKKDGITIIKNIVKKIVYNSTDLYNTLQSSNKKCKNESCLFFFIIIESSILNENGKWIYKTGKLRLIDLSENIDKLIKKNSISNYFNFFIYTLVNDYNTILAQLLFDSLGGNNYTLIIYVLSPFKTNYDKTLSIFQNIDCTKSIQNYPKINYNPKLSILRDIQTKIIKVNKYLLKKYKNENIIGLEYTINF